MILTPGMFQDVTLYPRRNMFNDKQVAILQALGLPTEAPKSAVDWVALLLKVEAGLAELLRILSLFTPKQGVMESDGCEPDCANYCTELYNIACLSIESAKKAFGLCHEMCVA